MSSQPSDRAAPDAGVTTLHIRCGSDLVPLLREGGFTGDYLEYSDPLCQGPVLASDDCLHRRAAFLANAYGAFVDRDHDQIATGLRQAEQTLRDAATTHERVVLWCEHDSYDQLMLARCLARFAETRPRTLELVQVSNHPGPARFIGLGQLTSEAFPPLWAKRRPISEAQLAAGTRVWEMLRLADPRPLAELARTGVPTLPFMAAALRRHSEEFPWIGDGLSLTERIALQLLAEQPRTMGEIFRDLMQERDPLPWLGDTMLRFILESMKRVDQPVFTTSFENNDRRWFRERLTISDTGHAVLAGTVDFMSLNPPERCLGGVTISPPGREWRWDDGAAAIVHA